MSLPRLDHPVRNFRLCRRSALPAMLILVMVRPAAMAAVPVATGPLFASGAEAMALVAPAAPVAPMAGSPAPDKAVSTTVDWTYVPGTDFSGLGASVGTVGDLNGDGFSDAAVGAPNMRDPDSFRVGAVLIFHGSASGLPAVPSQTLFGPRFASNYVEFGAALSPAGDVDGDGFGDLLVGAPGYGGDGAVFVHLGAAGGLQSSPAWSWTIDDFTAGSARLGASVSPAGDVDGDGFDDIVVAAPAAYAGFRGRAALFRGGVGGLSVAPAWDVTGALGDKFGASLAAAGDVNADGFDDVIVGVPGATGTAPPTWDPFYGQVSIFHGSGSGLGLTPATQLFGRQLNASFGAAVTGAGDMNGDGYADIGVGTPFWDEVVVDVGRVQVYSGSSAGVVDAPLWELTGVNSSDQLGTALAPGGDVNGDGLGEMLLGSPTFSNGGSGRGFVGIVTGSRVGSMLMSWYLYDAEQVNFGGAIGTAGDVDGDGFSDILVGSRSYTGTQPLEGRVQLFRGAADAPAPSIGWSARSGISNSFYGWVVASAGDVNGDGFDDVLATAPNATVLTPTVGLVVLFYGGASGPTSNANWFAVGPSTNSSFGFAAACAGDVNGDGYDDIVVGAPDYSHEGTVSVWYGGAGGPVSGPADWTVTGPQLGSHFGHSVASAGDVNGDGYADIIVGAPTDDSSFAGQVRPVDEGRAYLYLGSAAGLGTGAVWSALGGQGGGNLGNSVAGAGDVNGDGFGDVIVGMESWDQPVGPGLSLIDVGRAYVYHGNSAGLDPVPTTILQGVGSSNFGHVVGGAGDVDGDGFSDVIVTAVYSDPNDQGSVAVHRGSSGGVSTGAHWSFATGQAFSALGSWAGTAGDVNGDGLSDVVVGAVFHDQGGLQDNGRVWVFAGPLTGSAGTTALSQWGGSQSYENIGNSVAGLGDINGDGFADVGAGSPGFTGSVYKEGRTVLWYGNNKYQAHDTLVRRGQQRRLGGATPIGLGGTTAPDRDFLLQAWTGSAAGRTEVRLEWQVAALGAPTGGLVSSGPWADSAPGGAGTTLAIQSPPITVPGGGPAHWRLRVGSRSPYFPHSPWLSPSRNGRQETDLRWPGAIAGVEDGLVPPTMAARLQVTPNPFNPRTRISFDLRRDGRVRIELFDLAGRRVATLLDEVRSVGRVEVVWDGRDGQGRAAASGTYFARAAGGGRTATAKLVLIR